VILSVAGNILPSGGARTVPHRWITLPIPTQVSKRVTRMRRQQGMSFNITFFDRRGDEILTAYAISLPRRTTLTSTDSASSMGKLLVAFGEN
jgi:hypothetical protein